jgi:adenylate kinase family enzyme
MTRVAVIGNAGGGKSTMCRKLSKALDIEWFPIDRIQWKPRWTPASYFDLVNSYCDRKQVFHIQSPQSLRQFISQHCS